MGKANLKRKRKQKQTKQEEKVTVAEDEVQLEPVRMSDEPIETKSKAKWTNKQRVLIFATRGITHRDRHLMLNLHALMPHSKREPKMDKKDSTDVINEICESRNCNKSIFFENRKRSDLYMWLSNVPRGPCAKFLVENGMLELTELLISFFILSLLEFFSSHNGRTSAHGQLSQRFATIAIIRQKLRTTTAPSASQRTARSNLWNSLHASQIAAIHRPHFYVFLGRRSDMVSQLSNTRTGHTVAGRDRSTLCA